MLKIIHLVKTEIDTIYFGSKTGAVSGEQLVRNCEQLMSDLMWRGNGLRQFMSSFRATEEQRMKEGRHGDRRRRAEKGGGGRVVGVEGGTGLGGRGGRVSGGGGAEEGAEGGAGGERGEGKEEEEEG